MSATHKKVIVRLQNGVLHRGYLPDDGFAAGSVLELLLPDGKALQILLCEVLHIAYVRDFNLDDLIDPERIGLRSFASKPRTGGLWIRIQFPEGDSLEGIIHEGGVAFLDTLLRDGGVVIEPPSPRGNTQRLFVPRSAMAKFEVLAVAGGALLARRRSGKSLQPQRGLFELT